MNRRALLRVLCPLLVAGSLLSGCGKKAETTAATVPPGPPPEPPAGLRAVIETDKGEIEIEFFTAEAPRAVENFRLLTERGYYNGLTFHRIVKGFMIQGGDPLGTGMGGESAWGGSFPDEINRASPAFRRGYARGIVAMANSGPNTNGSQFFIMHQDYPLQPNYVIFGRVVRGQEVVDALAETPVRGERPVTPPVMRRVTIKRAQP